MDDEFFISLFFQKHSLSWYLKNISKGLSKNEPNETKECIYWNNVITVSLKVFKAHFYIDNIYLSFPLPERNWLQ